uniref:Uncharacterized protein n=1 Tax=Panagrolaimus davidi TaxID=227884 RepID=A0A914QX57_9BILA
MCFSNTFDDETAKLVTAETATELTKVIDTSELEMFCLYRIPTAFDFETFSKFTQSHEKIEFYVKSVS